MQQKRNMAKATAPDQPTEFTRQIIPIKSLTYNRGQVEGLPRNPRFIKDSKFEETRISIREDPFFIEARPVMVYEYGNILLVFGGEMRTRASDAEGNTTVHCLVFPESTPVEKIARYSIKDNGSYGEWDMDILANEWGDTEKLSGWGVTGWFTQKFHIPEGVDDDGDTEQGGQYVPKGNTGSMEGYTTFSIVLPIEVNKGLLEMLKFIKEKHQFESLTESLVYITEKFKP